VKNKETRMAVPDTTQPSLSETLSEILNSLNSLTAGHAQLAAQVDAISGRLNVLSEVELSKVAASVATIQNGHAMTPLPLPATNGHGTTSAGSATSPSKAITDDSSPPALSPMSSPSITPDDSAVSPPVIPRRFSTGTSKIILTSYPGQSGVDPIPFRWGNPDPILRGPVVVSRNPSTIRRRNAIGAHGGSYSIYFALAVASKNLDIDHKPDFTNTEPAATIGPFPDVWGDAKKIVSMDPYGHLAPWLYKGIIDSENIEIRPTIAVTRAHMKLPELEESVRKGRLVPDGKICMNSSGELAVTKIAVEPVWHLPGVAERFGIDEGTLRRALFEHTGGMYPELITRSDIKTFLPPIGGLTVYCFGDPAKMSNEKVRLALRVHDECNGSDGKSSLAIQCWSMLILLVFGSDICTCRPYLIFGIEEAVKEAQKGGSGVVIYFRKEGRALGEVTKYLVYNARKRGADKASEYFKRTENIGQ
jgi:GTP cyclohydrolase II